MNTQMISSLLPGLQIRDVQILSEQIVSERREIRVQLTLLAPNDRSVQPSREKVLIGAVTEKWMSMKFKAVKRSAYDRIESTVLHQILPRFGQYAVNELEPDSVQEWIDELAESYSYSTLTKSYQCLNAILDYAVLRNLIDHNRIKDRVMLPRNDGRSLRDVVVFSDEECERITKASYSENDNGETDPLAPLLPFLLHTGLRIGEALALRWSDIDMQHQFVRVRRNVKSVRNRSGKPDEPHYITIEQKTVKTKTSERIVHLNCEALQALSKLRRRSDSDLLFPNQSGSYCSYASIRRMMQRVFRSAQVPARGFHAFRHTFATKLFERGVEVKTVSSILGHSSVKITYDIYIHSIQEQEARAVALLEDPAHIARSA